MAFNYGYPTQFPATQLYGMMPTAPIQAPQNAPSAGQGLSLVSRLVSNRDEANAAPADFTGALMVFPDVNHNRIYLKRWNHQTGAADFLEFVPVVPEPEPTPQPVRYATAEDLEALRAEIEALKKPAGKAGKKNDPDE